MRHKFKLGKVVTILRSFHSGISLGDKGIIVSYEKYGYGVEFNKTWPTTFVNEKPPTGKRIVFIEEQDIK